MRGQSLVARDPGTREAMEQAAREENDHLVWCRTRLDELGAAPRRLDPLWFAGSLAIGAAAGLAGDRWSLGFIVETERQVVEHLDDHLSRLPDGDRRSRALLRRMQSDEQRHATRARAAGGAPLPLSVKSYQIDPFGAGVLYDKRTGQFRFVSQQEANRRAKREAALADFERLLDRYRELAKENDANRREALNAAVEAAVLAAGTQVERNEDPEEYAKGLTALIKKAISEGAKVSEGVPTATLQLLQSAFNDQLRTFAEINPNALLTLAEEERGEAASLERRLDGAPVNQAAAEAGLVCPGSLTRRRGFQILGPEGWRTFNQDDRLLMAMSSDASPIIGVLEDLSSRVLNARSRNEALLLPLAQERLRTVEAQRKLDQVPPDASPEEAIRAVLEAFNQSAGEEERSE